MRGASQQRVGADGRKRGIIFGEAVIAVAAAAQR